MNDYPPREKLLAAVSDACASSVEANHPADVLIAVASATEVIYQFVSALGDQGLEIVERR